MEAKQQLLLSLSNIYDQTESATIVDLVLENITGLKKVDRIIDKNKKLSAEDINLLKKYTGELMDHKPIQYVLQEAWFCGLKFYVNEHVLIPRPETEELVQWLLDDFEISKSHNQDAQNILDIGTGSGCIAIALKKKLPLLEISACDISKDALDVARHNAQMHEVNINFLQVDFLDRNNWTSVPSTEYIVSNPPYIPLSDKKSMKQNVIAYEPHIALFVANDNSLIFYEAIADFSVEKLPGGGKIFAEIHEELSDDVKQLFWTKGLSSVEIKKDNQGKNRMVKATMLL